MKKIIKITESQIKKIVELVLEQEEENGEWVKISANEFLELMNLASYYTYGVSRLPRFRGKKIWIVGDLNLSGTPTKDLTGIGYVEGNLDISKTDISDLSGVKVKGYTREWDSGVSRKKARLERQRKESEAQSRREDNEWDINNPDLEELGLAANALAEHLSYRNKIDIKTPLDIDRLEELERMLQDLENKESEYEEQGRDLTDVQADMEAAQDEIDEINKKLDIYDLYPSSSHYDMTLFEILGDYDFSGEEYAVGTEQEADDSLRDYAEDAVRDLDNFNRNFVESHIDADAVADYAEEFYNDVVRESPESYFNDDDYELTDEQKSRISEIERQIAELEEKQNNLEHEIEEPSEYSDAYDEIQSQIDDLESEKEDIEPEVGNPSDEMIDDKVAELVYDVKRDPESFIDELGLDKRNFIDEKSLIEDLIDTDGYALISPYDGGYDSVTVKDEHFIIIRLN